MDEKELKEILYDISFNDFTDSADGALIIDLEKFIQTALLEQKELIIRKVRSLD